MNNFSSHTKKQVQADVVCPFCGERDFDLIGLKNHLKFYCNTYDELMSIEEERQVSK